MAAERILIVSDKEWPCNSCLCRCNDDEQVKCEHFLGNIQCADKRAYLSREDAIERINHAICVEVHGPCDICEQVRGGNEGHCNDYKKYAEAALNALLGE